MTPTEAHEQLGRECLAILRTKNKDYRGGDAGIFSNFEKSELLGVPATTSLMIRMMDKHQRVRAFIKNRSLAVKTESVKDACMDLHNYTVLLNGMFEGVKGMEDLLKKRLVIYRSAALQLPMVCEEDPIILLDQVEATMTARPDPMQMLVAYSSIASAVILPVAVVRGRDHG